MRHGVLAVVGRDAAHIHCYELLGGDDVIVNGVLDGGDRRLDETERAGMFPVVCRDPDGQRQQHERGGRARWARGHSIYGYVRHPAVWVEGSAGIAARIIEASGRRCAPPALKTFK